MFTFGGYDFLSIRMLGADGILNRSNISGIYQSTSRPFGLALRRRASAVQLVVLSSGCSSVEATWARIHLGSVSWIEPSRVRVGYADGCNRRCAPLNGPASINTPCPNALPYVSLFFPSCYQFEANNCDAD